jgi:PKD repeat protein
MYDRDAARGSVLLHGARVVGTDSTATATRGGGTIIGGSWTSRRFVRVLCLSVASSAIFASTADAAAPIACFTQTPAVAVAGQAVTFDSACSRDPDSTGRITGRAWDLDNDGSFDDGTGTTATKTFSTSGTFTVRLGVMDNSNNVDVETKTVTVNAPPSASFTSSPANPSTGTAVTFTSTSTDSDGTITGQAWDLDNDGGFDDGTTASVSQTFATPGEKTVKLRVTDNRGTQDTETKTIAVANRAPTVAITSDPASPLSGQTFTLTASAGDPDGSVASYAWDVDGNGTDNFAAGTATKTASFAAPGTYPVKVRVTDNSGAATVATLNVTVGNRAPTVSLASSPALPQTGQTFTLTATAADTDGSVASYAWDVDGNATDDFTAGPSTKTASFAAKGTYPMKVRVTDNGGASTVAKLDVSVGNRAPIADFTQSLPNPTTGQLLTLSSTSTDPDGTIVSYAWAIDHDGLFDDGTGSRTSRSFTFPGTRNVKLRVTDNDGVSTTVTKTVTIANRAPVGVIDIAPAAPLVGEEVTFSSGSSDPDGTITSLAWALDSDGAFDDGTTGTVKRTYTEPGDYPVKLRVRDNDGGETTVNRTITVGNRAPTAAFSFAPAAPLVGEEVTLTSSSEDADGTIARQDWDLDGDGDFADDATEGATATTTFSTGGLHVVGLRVTDDRGAVSEATQTIDVAEPLEAPRSDPSQPGQIFDTSIPVGPPPPIVQPPAPLQWLNPFPTVRLRGRTTRSGVTLSLFTVRAPTDSIVSLTCKGRRCPVKSLRAKVKGRKGASTGTTRIRRLERSLRAGTILQVRVAKPGLVGKYTEIKIRSIALPIRRDRCLLPDSTRPVKCPATP